MSVAVSNTEEGPRRFSRQTVDELISLSGHQGTSMFYFLTSNSGRPGDFTETPRRIADALGVRSVRCTNRLTYITRRTPDWTVDLFSVPIQRQHIKIRRHALLPLTSSRIRDLYENVYGEEGARQKLWYIVCRQGHPAAVIFFPLWKIILGRTPAFLNTRGPIPNATNRNFLPKRNSVYFAIFQQFRKFQIPQKLATCWIEVFEPFQIGNSFVIRWRF